MESAAGQNQFYAKSDALSELVRRSLAESHVDEIFAPRVNDDVAEALFPGFATFLHPNVSARLFTRFSKLPKLWLKDWHARIYLNTLSAAAIYDEKLRHVLTAVGPVPEDEKASETIGTAINREWRFALWSYAQAAEAPEKTFFRFDLLTLASCFVIETVESRVNGQSGGWHLLEEVIHVLDAQGTDWEIPWIHCLATNGEAVKMFQHYGFVAAPVKDAIVSSRATPLRRDDRMCIRSRWREAHVF